MFFAIVGDPLAEAAASAPYDWLQMNGDPQHSGNNTREEVLGPGNVANLKLFFQVSLPASADGAPVALSSVVTPSGTRNLLFSTTKLGHIVALDADTGAVVWSHENSGSGSTNASPAIDPNRLYVYSYGLDGHVHKYRVGDGTEITTGGWPQLGTRKGNVEKVPAALAFATAANGTTYLYLVHDGYIGDAGDYQGHVTTIDLSTGAQKVFNTLCSDQVVHFVLSPGTPDCGSQRSGIWAKNGVTYDDVTDRVYFATGNGRFNANSGGHNWGDSVLALPADGAAIAGGPADSYTPVNFQELENGDRDLGSTGPAILPASSYAGRLAVQSGKDGQLRLIDLSDMSGQGGPGHVGGELEIEALPQGGGVLTTPAVWIDPADGSTWVFVVNGAGSSAMKLTFAGGAPSLVKQWQSSLGGSSPLIANDVLYFANDTTIRALDARTGKVLWSDATNISGNHWQSPIVFNATLYVTDEAKHLTAWALRPPATPTQTVPPTNTPTRRPTSTPTPTRTRTPTPTRTPTRTPTPPPTPKPTSTPTATPVPLPLLTADRVLGQPTFTSKVATYSPSGGLSGPRGVAIDTGVSPNRIYVADSKNHRVLAWADASSFTNGEDADLVIGQPSFTSMTCNSGGVSASSLCSPQAVAVDGVGNLYVADGANNRVLEYDKPFTSDTIADRVFGQFGSFASVACNTGGHVAATTLCGPKGIALDASANLYVADTENNRVLEYDAALTGDATADFVFGQGNFTVGQCNGGGAVTANTLCRPIAVATDPSGNVYVADTGNNRVLEYGVPLGTDRTADLVFGQLGSFTTKGCNRGGVINARTLCGPTGVFVDPSGNTFIADAANNRLLEYDTPLSLGVRATRIFGQNRSFASRSCNKGGVGAASLCTPRSAAMDGSRNLYVVDNGNNRILKYDDPL